MSQQIGKKTPRKWRPTFINSVLMVALVLFILGMIGMMLLHYQELSTRIKENIKISLYLHERVNEVEAIQLQKRIETAPFVHSTEYISKEEASEKWLDMTGEDYRDVLPDNPFPAAIDINLNAGYANPDSIRNIRQGLGNDYGRYIRDLEVDETLTTAIDTNLHTVGIILLAIIALLVLITILLIDSTVRLAMYSNRFLIKNMQMIGATRWFIVRPYVYRSIINGLLSGLLAVAAIIGFLYLAQQYFPEIQQLQNLFWWGFLFLCIILLGIMISFISTWRAVTKYLKMKLDDLY